MAMEKKPDCKKRKIKLDPLSKKIDKKVKEINNISKLLETNINQLKKLVEKKRIKTNEYIQASKKIRYETVGEIIRNVHITQEKAKAIKFVVEEETMKMQVAEARRRTLAKRDMKDIENLLAMTQAQFDQRKKEMEEKVAKEKSKIKHEFQCMAEKEAKTKEILNLEVSNMKKKAAKEKNKIESEIKKLVDEIKQISGEIQNMRIEKLRKIDELYEIQKNKITEKMALKKEIETLTTEIDMEEKSRCTRTI